VQHNAVQREPRHVYSAHVNSARLVAPADKGIRVPAALAVMVQLHRKNGEPFETEVRRP